jgi:hypothetical protein
MVLLWSTEPLKILSYKHGAPLEHGAINDFKL